MFTKRTETLRQRQDRRFINKETQTAAKYLRRMKELSGAPEGIEPFYNTLERIYVDMDYVKSGAYRHTIGTYCVMTPP